MTFDASELNRLETDLAGAGIRAAALINATTVVAAGKIKATARSLITGLRHAPAYPYSITYDIKWNAVSVEAEIGPDKDLAQGALGNLLEFGSRNNPPHAHMGPALDREGPVWLGYVEDAAGKSVLG